MVEPEQFLPEMGRRLANSRQRLSRIGRKLAGISQHRWRVWMRAALERPGGGGRNPPRVAAAAGCTGETRLWIVARAETGTALATLRRALV